MKNAALFLLPVLLLAAALALFVATCEQKSEVRREPSSSSSRRHDFNANNPDRDVWIDPRKHQFMKEWVGGTLVLTEISAPITFNNLLWESSHVYAKHFLYPHLLMEVPDRVGGHFTVEPWAALEMPKRLEDDRTFIWKLKPDLTWEDGTPVTSADYEFTWDLLQDREVLAPGRRAAFERVESVRALGDDDHTIEVRFKEPYYNAVTNFGLQFTVVPRHAVPRDPQEFNDTKRHPSFGPYRLVHWDQKRVSLELRPEYRERPHPVGSHYVEAVDFQFIIDYGTKITQLKAGELHVATIKHDDYDRLAGDPSFANHCWRTYYFLPTYHFIAWNTKDPKDPDYVRPHPLFADAKVRMAMAHLIPRARMRDEYYRGRAVLVTGPSFFMDADYDDAVPIIDFNPTKARELLAEAGWTLGQSGILEKEGRRFEFKLMVGKDSVDLNHLIRWFSEAAAKIGVVVILEDVEFQYVLVPRIHRHDFDAVCAINALRPPIEPDHFQSFHSEQARLESENYGGLADTKVDALIEGYRSQFDPKRRLELRRQLHHRIHELQPFAFLYSVASSVAVNHGWANVKVHDLGIMYRDFIWRELLEKHPAN